MTLEFSSEDLAEAARFNRKLALAPKFRIRSQFDVVAIQTLLRASQLGADQRLRRSGLMVETSLAPTTGAGVPLRVIRPLGAVRGLVLQIHGGGWAIGNAKMDDQLNAAMARACDVAVVSVDYRLAGQASITDLLEDCLSASSWILDGGLPELADLPAVIVGESAGAHLAAATLLQLKASPEQLRRVAGAVLYYGVYDLAGTESVRQAGPDTLVLDGPSLIAGLRLLTPGMGDEDRRLAPLSPLFGDLTGLPPALLFAGGLDPLRDDSIQMADRWAAVAPVEFHLVPEAPHGFIRFKTQIARKSLARSYAWIIEALGRPGYSGSKRSSDS
jgi:acetyl esterase/lipase